jgi:hypothetical protein
MRSDQSNAAAGAVQRGIPGDRPVQAGGDAAPVPQMQAEMPEPPTAPRPRVSFRDWAAI